MLIVGTTPHCCHRRPALSLPEDPAAGRAGFEFLLDPVASSYTFNEGEALIRPQPMAELEPPRYPARPLDARFGSATVVVRIVIDEGGLVDQVLDSPLMASSPGPFAEDFRKAVEDAVHGWGFTPGMILQTQTRPGERPVRPVPVYYDVRFDFEIVAGEGRATIVGPPHE